MSVFLKGHFISCSEKFSTHYVQCEKKKKSFERNFYFHSGHKKDLPGDQK